MHHGICFSFITEYSFAAVLFGPKLLLIFFELTLEYMLWFVICFLSLYHFLQSTISSIRKFLMIFIYLCCYLKGVASNSRGVFCRFFFNFNGVEDWSFIRRRNSVQNFCEWACWYILTACRFVARSRYQWIRMAVAAVVRRASGQEGHLQGFPFPESHRIFVELY